MITHLQARLFRKGQYTTPSGQLYVSTVCIQTAECFNLVSLGTLLAHPQRMVVLKSIYVLNFERICFDISVMVAAVFKMVTCDMTDALKQL